jgi:uncharacterized Zn finger protein
MKMPGLINSYLEQLDEVQLRKLLLEFAASLPAVRQKLELQGKAITGQATELLHDARAEIKRLKQESGSNRWDDYGYSPDTTDLMNQLEALFKAKQFDQLVGLGASLMVAADQAIEMTHDESGEFGEQIQACFDIILSALPASSLSLAQQLIYLVDLQLEDDYDFISFSKKDDSFWDTRSPSSDDWNVLVLYLQSKLEQRISKGDSTDYPRNQIRDWLEHALDKAGRASEVALMLEAEAEKTNDFTRIVAFFIEAKQFETADLMIQRGLSKVPSGSSGRAQQLRDSWRKIRTQAQDWRLLTSHSAVTFFQDPTLSAYRSLETDALRANLWAFIEPQAKQFLETGVTPDLEDWSLPILDLPMPPERRVIREQAPFFRTLFELAIAENKPDDVLRWYEFKPSSEMALSAYRDAPKNRVAMAIQHQYPDKAMAFWQELADSVISQTGDQNYRTAIGYLEKIRIVLVRLERTNDWKMLLESLHTVHKRKRLFTQMLNQLPS